MKIIKYTAGVALLSGIASAQGLFNVNPNADESEVSPLKYTANVSFGYDDNVRPTSGLTEVSSSYLKGSLNASIVVRGPRTSWDISATGGATHYLGSLPNDDTIYNARIAYNINHQFNDLLRYRSSSFFNYGIDLGSFYGPVTSRQLEEYFYCSSDHALGYRWTDRLATYTGVTYSTVNYADTVNDVDSLGFYNNFRYSLSPQTVLKANYKYSNAEYTGADISSQMTTVGVEQKLTSTSTISVDVGVQFRVGVRPSASVTYANKINNQLKARIFAHYSQEDTDTVFPGGRYDDKTTLRAGGAIDYVLSPQVKLTVGGNYSQSEYEKGSRDLVDGDWDLFNVYTSVAYKVDDVLSLSASVNFTTSDSSTSIVNRNYDRNRFQVGANYSF